jgi:D-alanyl-D-alanine carboxypeptidase
VASLLGHLARILLCVLVVAAAAPAPAAPFAAIVQDARTGETLYARNADTRLHPASLTKMLTLYIAFEAIERGEITLDTKITISQHAASQQPSRLGLKAGQRVALRYLIRAAAIKSANDAATAIAEGISGSEARFAQRMNRTAKALGMKNSTFKNANGLTAPGHLSTARDMNILGRRLFYDYPQYYNIFSRRTADAGLADVANTNRRFLDSYRGADGIKTGYTVAAGFNLTASAERDGVRLIATVFGGTSTANRNARMAELLDDGFRKAPRHVVTRKPKPPVYDSPPETAEIPMAEAEVPDDSIEGGNAGDVTAGKTIRLVTAVKSSPRPQPRPAPGTAPDGAPDGAPAGAPAGTPEEPAVALAGAASDGAGADAEAEAAAATMAALDAAIEGAVAEAVAPLPFEVVEGAATEVAAAGPGAAPDATAEAVAATEVAAAAPPAPAPSQLRPQRRPGAAATAAGPPAAALAEATPSPAPPAAPADPPDAAPAAVAAVAAAASTGELPFQVVAAADLPPAPAAGPGAPPPPADAAVPFQVVAAPPALAADAEIVALSAQRPAPAPAAAAVAAAPAEPAVLRPAPPPDAAPMLAAAPEVVTRISTSGGRHWGISLGDFATRSAAERALMKTMLAESATLGDGLRKIVGRGGGHNAVVLGLTEDEAALACRRLAARAVPCEPVGP